MQENRDDMEDAENADYESLKPPLDPGDSEPTNVEADLFAQNLERLFVDSDVWASAENSFVRGCDDKVCNKDVCTICGYQGDTHERKSAPAKNPKINDSVLGTMSTTDNNVPSASELLQLVLESYRSALIDQRSIMADQTEAIKRLAAAIEEQTKMISLLRDNNR